MNQLLISIDNLKNNKCIFLILILLIIQTDAFSQYTAIPDSNFESTLAMYDDIPGDGQVPTLNISTVTTLTIASEGIADLSGIEDFISLTSILAQNNMIASIDLSTLPLLQTINIDNNLLTSLNVDMNPQLRTLICQII